MTDGARVWVVDDDRSVRFVLAAALREAGFAVTAFAAAGEALEALGREAPPALVVTDVRMPGDSGLQLLDKLKAAHPALPLAWGTVLIAVPLFWLTAIAWFARMVF